MNVSYKGMKQELPPKIQSKLDAKFAKLSKLLEKRGEKEAHVVVTNERHLHQAEVTIQFYDHQLVGVGSDGDLFKALSEALERLETQAVKQRTKWREKHRKDTPAKGEGGETTPEQPEAKRPDGKIRKRVFRVNHQGERKPMTLEEALIEIDKDQDYLVYRDADKECLSVLVRRRDGHFDLIEG
jgi:putative sigma-54 modulation protein